MSSQEPTELERTQAELEMWKQRYFALEKVHGRCGTGNSLELQALKQRYFNLRLSHGRLLNVMSRREYAGKKDSDIPPAKRQRLEIPDDPLELPETCAMRILDFLPANELFKATAVSNKWREFIESRNKAMKRALDGTVVKIDLSQENIANVHSAEFNRDYKHMKVVVGSDLLKRTIPNWLLYPIIQRASTLESLTLSVSYDVTNELFKLNFPNLVRLDFRCYGSPFKKLPEHHFPELTTLKIDCCSSRVRQSVQSFKTFLEAFPNLKHFQFLSLRTDDFLMDDVEAWGTVPDPVVIEPLQPDLQTVVFSYYTPRFLRSHQNSLTKLSVGAIDTRGLFYCLRDLKKLKHLKIESLEQAEEVIVYPQHDSIKFLNIGQNFVRSEDFHLIFIALPSLIEFSNESSQALGDEGGPYRIDIRFIASNMRHLKRLKIRHLTNDDQADYDDAKKNADQYINTEFKLTNDYDENYSGFLELTIS